MSTTTAHQVDHGCPPLIESSNGVVSPLYFPRQLVLAEDLTLDRTSRDAELARAHLLLHGWGVVAGLIPTVEGDTLSVVRGYAITPTGTEVYLAADLAIDRIREAVLACCGDAERCSLDPPDDGHPGDDGQEGEPAPLISWLVARPTSHSSAARAGAAAGCRHPANALHPTRRCSGVRLELLCELPESHTTTLDPQTVDEIACGTLGLSGDATLMPMPELPGPEADFVVLGQLAVLGDVVGFSTFGRRALLPTQVLQDWIVRRTCLSRYFVNRVAQPNGDHELHLDGCFLRTQPRNRVELGELASPDEAIAAARAAGYVAVDGCRFCLPTVHHR